MAGKLTEEQRQEIVRRYEAGVRSPKLAADYCCSVETVCKVLRAAGIANHSRKEISSISRARWQELYWGAESGLPNMEMLARQLGFTEKAIRRHLRLNEINLRTASQQRKIDIRAGRVVPPQITNVGPNPSNFVARQQWQKGRPLEKAARAKMIAKRRAQTTREVRPCWWCGCSIERLRCYFRRQDSFCSYQHGGLGWRFRQAKGKGSPRPLIVDRLRELLRQEPYKALSPSRTTVEKAGATIGAGEAEISLVLSEITPASVPISPAPVVTSEPKPTRGRQQRTVKPEEIGAVGEALLRAQREAENAP